MDLISESKTNSGNLLPPKLERLDSSIERQAARKLRNIPKMSGDQLKAAKDRQGPGMTLEPLDYKVQRRVHRKLERLVSNDTSLESSSGALISVHPDDKRGSECLSGMGTPILRHMSLSELDTLNLNANLNSNPAPSPGAISLPGRGLNSRERGCSSRSQRST
mmetsp:Transcript_10834/g.14076  ORF Transcript_10834/g.14076 Transcript_10834/m.14076 type:complete len:163 (-) Transcript_10834:444-932(-)